MNIKHIISKIRSIVRSDLKGSALEAAIIKLDLDDPIFKLCEIAGSDSTGKIRCSICALSNGIDAGCMKYVDPIKSALAQRNSTKAKVRLETLAQRLDAINEASDAVYDTGSV